MLSGELITGELGARPGHVKDLTVAWATLAQVMDPEVPVVSVIDLGIVRAVSWRSGHLHVVITPTYSGCPATDMIAHDIRQALERAGFKAPAIEQQLSPAWTTDWVTSEGRRRLQQSGIALPGATVAVTCPRCASPRTELLSRFGSTACKSLYRCRTCGDPFECFKCL